MAVDITQVLQANNLVLFLGLVLVFVLAYKVMKTVVQSAIIAVFSAVFFYALTYMGIGPEFTLTNVLFFTVLGPALYLGYTLLFQFTSIATSLTTFFTRLVTGVWNLLKKIGGVFTTEENSSNKGSTTPQSTGASNKSESSEKEIILDELED